MHDCRCTRTLVSFIWRYKGVPSAGWLDRKIELNIRRLGPILELAELDLDDAALQCYRDGVSAIVRAKFRQNLLHVGLNRFFRDFEVVGDYFVGVAPRLLAVRPRSLDRSVQPRYGVPLVRRRFREESFFVLRALSESKNDVVQWAANASLELAVEERKFQRACR